MIPKIVHSFANWLCITFPLPPLSDAEIQELYKQEDEYRKICGHPLEARELICMQCGETLWNASCLPENYTHSSNCTDYISLEKHNA